MYSKTVYIVLFFAMVLAILTKCKNEKVDLDDFTPIHKVIDCSFRASRHFRIVSRKEDLRSLDYLIIDDYNQECFTPYFLLERAYEYLDTVTLMNEAHVESIYFCSTSDGFSNLEGYQNWTKIKQTFVMSINFKKSTISNACPEIYSLTYWIEGVPYKVYLLGAKMDSVCQEVGKLSTSEPIRKSN